MWIVGGFGTRLRAATEGMHMTIGVGIPRNASPAVATEIQEINERLVLQTLRIRGVPIVSHPRRRRRLPRGGTPLEQAARLRPIGANVDDGGGGRFGLSEHDWWLWWQQRCWDTNLALEGTLVAGCPRAETPRYMTVPPGGPSAEYAETARDRAIRIQAAASHTVIDTPELFRAESYASEQAFQAWYANGYITLPKLVGATPKFDLASLISVIRNIQHPIRVLVQIQTPTLGCFVNPYGGPGDEVILPAGARYRTEVYKEQDERIVWWTPLDPIPERIPRFPGRHLT